MLFSQTDDYARSKLAAHYAVETVASLKNCTFRGARANATVVRFKPLNQTLGGRPTTVAPRRSIIRLLLVRGGLPVYQAETRQAGIPFLHSTDIAAVAKGRWTPSVELVAGIGRGRVGGAVVLIPRVGVPRIDSIAAAWSSLDSAIVRLRYCVEALYAYRCRDPGSNSPNEVGVHIPLQGNGSEISDDLQTIGLVGDGWCYC